MNAKAPGKSLCEGISLIELAEMFPDEDAAHDWFEAHVWPDGRYCPRCGSVRTHEASHSKMPYRCSDCRSYFSTKTGTALERSKIPLLKWAWAIYLEVTSLKGVSSMKLHRDLGVTQKTAWFMLHRMREAWADGEADPFAGLVEADETWIGGKRRNMPKAKRRGLTGRGAVGKTAVVGVKDRGSKRVNAKVAQDTGAAALQGFVVGATLPDAVVYTDDASAYRGMDREPEAVRHSVGEYVHGMAHTNGTESFWSMLKRGYHGTYHHFSVKHTPRYVAQFAGKHNFREQDTIVQMQAVVAGMIGRRLMYRDLVS